MSNLIFKRATEGEYDIVETSKIRFVLVNTTHPGNIGATARAMKNMGFENLCLVAPLQFPDPIATLRASGAEDLLINANVVSTVEEAIMDCHLVFGSSARSRRLQIPCLTPMESASKADEAVKSGNSVAILFGQERSGLSNAQLELCHYHIAIPCNPAFPSLNLAAAVQIIAYELHQRFFSFSKFSLLHAGEDRVRVQPVNTAEMEKFYLHLEQTLIEIGFLNPNNPRQMMRKLRRLFNRISIEQNEMNILRGILGMIQKR